MHWSLTGLENFVRSVCWGINSAREPAAATDAVISPEPEADQAELEDVISDEIDIDKLPLEATQQFEWSMEESEKLTSLNVRLHLPWFIFRP